MDLLTWLKGNVYEEQRRSLCFLGTWGERGFYIAGHKIKGSSLGAVIVALQSVGRDDVWEKSKLRKFPKAISQSIFL